MSQNFIILSWISSLSFSQMDCLFLLNWRWVWKTKSNSIFFMVLEFHCFVFVYFFIRWLIATIILISTFFWAWFFLFFLLLFIESYILTLSIWRLRFCDRILQIFSFFFQLPFKFRLSFFKVCSIEIGKIWIN
jgi:hypothetical protein